MQSGTINSTVQKNTQAGYQSSAEVKPEALLLNSRVTCRAPTNAEEGEHERGSSKQPVCLYWVCFAASDDRRLTVER